MGNKNSRSRRHDSSNISPEANPESGKEVNVFLPNQNSTLSHVYPVQTAGEFKIDCLSPFTTDPDTVEVVLVFANAKEVILNDMEDFGDRLNSLERIELRIKGTHGNDQVLKDAIHYK